MALYPLLPNPSPQFCDANGNPYAAGTLTTLIPDTDTPKATWSDPAGASLNTNPIVLDAAGRCVIHGDGLYRMVLKDADGNLVFDLPSSTLVSAAMAPVMIAPTIADALELLGVTDAIEAAVGIETTRAEAAEAAELTRASGVEDALDLRIGTEINRAEAAEAAETARALAAEADLAAAIGAIPSVSGIGSFHAGRATSDGSGFFNVGWSPPFANACISFQVYGVFPPGTDLGLAIWPSEGFAPGVGLSATFSCQTWNDAGHSVDGTGTVSQVWGRLFWGAGAGNTEPGTETDATSTDFYWLAFGY